MPTVIPFNTDAVEPRQVLFAGDATEPAAYRLPTVAVESGRPLRLNSGQIEFGDPPPLRDMPDAAGQLAFLCEFFRHQCGVWNKHARLFLDLYFEFIGREIADHAPALEDRLARFGRLYSIDHWAFSAPRPLPRAHLDAQESPDDSLPDRLVRTEIAFWTAAGPVALDLIGANTRGTKEARWRARLDAASVRVIEMPHSVLDANDAAAFAERLPDDFRAFWKGDALPSGPFKSAAAPGPLPD